MANESNKAKRGRKPKYLHTIVLTGINVREIYKRYKSVAKDGGQTSVSPTPTFLPIISYAKGINGESASSNGQVIAGNLTQLGTGDASNVFLNKVDKSVTMVDYIKCGCMPERTDLWCGHCRHEFNTSPIGIPIRYVKKKPDMAKSRFGEGEIEGTNDYFLTCGVFCSWSCCLAHISEFSHRPLFKTSKSLLHSMYYKIYGVEMQIKKAPSWECLKVHGGDLTIQEFRDSFCKCSYVITPNIKRPYMVAVGKYVEKKRCGF